MAVISLVTEKVSPKQAVVAEAEKAAKHANSSTEEPAEDVVEATEEAPAEEAAELTSDVWPRLLRDSLRQRKRAPSVRMGPHFVVSGGCPLTTTAPLHCFNIGRGHVLAERSTVGWCGLSMKW